MNIPRLLRRLLFPEKKMVDPIAALAAVRYLCAKQNEHTGYLDSATGVVVRLSEGDEHRCSHSLAKAEAMRIFRGEWVGFHTHPSGTEPSSIDKFNAHLFGVTQYVVVPDGIWEITPLPTAERRRVIKECLATIPVLEEAIKIGFLHIECELRGVSAAIVIAQQVAGAKLPSRTSFHPFRD